MWRRLHLSAWRVQASSYSNILDFDVAGDMVYLAVSNPRLLVLDVSAPSTPRVVDSHFIPAFISSSYRPSVAVSGGRVYVASYGIYIYGEKALTPTPSYAPSTVSPATGQSGGGSDNTWKIVVAVISVVAVVIIGGGVVKFCLM